MLAALICLSAVAARDGRQAVSDAFATMAEGHYLPAVRQLEQSFHEGSVDDRNYVGQFLAYAYAMVGDVDAAELTMDKVVPPDDTNKAPVPTSLKGAIAVNALDAIREAARNRQIVMLNESHLESRNRAFALQVARALRKEGFQYFAAETFTPDVFDSWDAGYPRLKIGRYTMDPYFGDLVRQAMKMGYRPMNYEAQGLSPSNDWIEAANKRDSLEADNLVNRILKRNPHARIFVYCGAGHLTKDVKKPVDGRELMWMAARLKRATGIDPLTIDQSLEVPHSSRAAETPEYRFVSATKIDKPTIYRSKEDRWLVFGDDFKDGAADMQVFHPRGDGWMFINNYRGAYIITVPEGSRLLVQAFSKSEPNDAVPMDQRLNDATANFVPLFLPKGEYRIIAQDENGNSRVLNSHFLAEGS